MRILQFSDVHFWRYGLDFDPTLKRALGFANLAMRRARKFPPKLAPAVMEAIAREKADVICFTGDISTSALKWEFRKGHKETAAIREKWGDRFLSIPGNHDRYTRRSTKRTLFEEYFVGRDIVFPFLQTIGGVDFVGIDTTKPCIWTSRGTFPTTRLNELDELLKKENRGERPIVMLGHYPYALPDGKIHKWVHRLEEAAALAELVKRHNVALYLHGHVHHRWAHHPDATPETLCVNSGSAGMKTRHWQTNAGYVLIDLNAESGEIKGVTGRVWDESVENNLKDYPVWPRG